MKCQKCDFENSLQNTFCVKCGTELLSVPPVPSLPPTPPPPVAMRIPPVTPAPAPEDFLEGADDGHYGYNAGRDPWRIGADALLSGDAASRAAAVKISLWAESTTAGDPTAFHSGYDLDGNPTEGSDYFTTFFVAPLGVAAMNNPDQQEWLNAVYDAVYQTHEDYYEDTVTLLCLITMSGNAWVP